MKIKLKPDLVIDVLEEESLMAALIRCRVPVLNVCNGKGTCGKCKVRLLAGVPEPSPQDLKHLSQEELEAGIRLACSVRPQAGMEIEVGIAEAYDRKEAALSQWYPEEIDSGLKKVFLQLPRPSLEDQRGDWDRLAAELADDKITADLALLTRLPEIVRERDFAVTTALWGEKVIAVEAGDTTQTMYGAAVDIGTTSVAVALVDLVKSEVIKVVSGENGQISYGADVISRISYARESLAQRLDLRSAVRETVNGLLEQLVTAAGIAPESIYKMTFVANTTMSHLFLGLGVDYLAVSPYVSSCNKALELSAAELNLNINPHGIVLAFPNIGSFVGGDTLGAVIGAPQALEPGNHLLVDLGTNCELFLSTPQGMIACSTAAGPAFEGAGIGQGMRAKPGAIEGVKITADKVQVSVIDKKQAVGICGSGLIEAIDQMKKCGIISKQGAIVDPEKNHNLATELKQRIRQGGKNGREFVLAYGGADGVDVVLTQKDVGQLQLAKGAVSAGIKTIVGMAGISLGELDSVILAGTFASYLNAESILAIGLVPNLPPEKIKTVGNAAHAGALRALADQSEFVKASRLATQVKHIELGGNKTFTDHFMRSMYIEPTE